MSAENKIAPGPAEPESRIVAAAAGDAEGPNPAEGDAPPPSSAAETGNAVRALVARLPPGTIIDDKYVIQSAIGRGGMGVVMSAHHQHLSRDVALKFLCMPGGGQDDLRTRFRREAQVNAKLRNEHITRVLDVGSWEGISFMVMERLEGADLRRTMRKEGGALPLDQALNYTLQLCEGIAEAHAHGIVHRDLKPSNLFITQNPDGSPLLKIMDFGISKWKDDEVGEITKDGTVLGSPKYMAPEQLFGGAPVDARADVWSIAAICYEMIGGRTPYTESTLARFCAEIMTGPPPPLASVARQQVPQALSDALGRCFERDAAKRPQSVAELAGELLDAMDSSGASLREKLQAIIAMRPRDPDASGPRSMPSLTGLAPSSGVSHVSSVVTPAARPSGAPRAFLVAGGILALVGVCLLAAAWYRGSTSHADTTTVAALGSPAVTAPAATTPVATTPTTPAATTPPTDPPSTSQTAAMITPPPKTPGVATRTVKPPASHPGGTAPGTAATGTPPTKADDDIPTMR